MSRVSRVGVAVVAVVWLSAPATAAGGGPEPGRLYESEDDGDASLTLLPVGRGPSGRALVEIAATFECEELSLKGVVLATVKRDGTFSAKSTGFTLADGGTDEVDAHVEVRGKFESGAAGVTIDAKARAFDNAGTTGRCEAQSRWVARAGDPDPALDRIAATTPFDRPGGALVAADADAAYVATLPDEAKTARLHRVDAETGERTWTVRPGPAIGSLSAGAGGVWVADGRRSRVIRLDPATGDEVAVIPLELNATEARGGLFASIVATDDAVWVAAPGGLLHRIDPATNSIAATIPLNAMDADDAVVAAGGTEVFVALDLPRPEDAPGPPLRLVRVDAASNAITASADLTGQTEALAATDDGLYALLLGDPVVRFDAATLTEIDRLDVEGSALAAAPPGIWVLTADGLRGYDAASSSPGVTVPIIGGDFGAVAASGDAIWVWDPRVGALTRVEAG